MLHGDNNRPEGGALAEIELAADEAGAGVEDLHVGLVQPPGDGTTNTPAPGAAPSPLSAATMVSAASTPGGRT